MNATRQADLDRAYAMGRAYALGRVFTLGMAYGLGKLYARRDLVAWDAKEGKVRWITVHGAKVPVGENGELQGAVGRKIEAESEQQQGDWGSEENQRKRNRKVTTALNLLLSGHRSEATINGLRNDLAQYGGTNDVTLVMGDKNKGIEHIQRRHPGALKGVLDALANGKVEKYVPGNETVWLDKGVYRAVLSLIEKGRRKTWLLTGFDTTKKD